MCFWFTNWARKQPPDDIPEVLWFNYIHPPLQPSNRLLGAGLEAFALCFSLPWLSWTPPQPRESLPSPISNTHSIWYLFISCPKSLCPMSVLWLLHSNQKVFYYCSLALSWKFSLFRAVRILLWNSCHDVKHGLQAGCDCSFQNISF